jgi:hypothetical protein
MLGDDAAAACEGDACVIPTSAQSEGRVAAEETRPDSDDESRPNGDSVRDPGSDSD